MLIRFLIIRESEYDINNSNSNKGSGGYGTIDVYHDDVSSCNTPLSSDGNNNGDKVTESISNHITLSFNNTFNFTCDDLQENIDAEDSGGEGVTNENYFHDLYLDKKESAKKKLETQLSQIRASKHEEHCKNKESAV